MNAIHVWGIARSSGGRVLLRIEDHDRIRSRAGFEAALLEDLEWLGLVPDEGRHPLNRQHEHAGRYERAVARLRARHHVYACDCSRRETGGLVYSGRCRHRGLPEIPGHGLRVVMMPGRECFTDLALGRLEQEPAAQCGDLLLKDRDGHWTYQFAVTVDDMEEEVTLVIRGQDLVSSTGRQLRLARMLGRARPPRYLHHPLLLRPDGQKLSKSLADTGVRELRAAGASAADVLGRAAHAIGLSKTPTPLPASDLHKLFLRQPARKS